MTWTRILAVALPASWALFHSDAALATPANAEAASRGAKAYGRYCVSCHGEHGDGRGPSADWIDPRPRILTSGTFKFRSTPAGELPTDEDVFHTITNGLHHTNMPHWDAATEMERRDLVQYLKTLSPRFASEPQGKSIVIPPRPAFTPALVTKGKEVYAKMGCANCHGDGGKGDGSSASTLRDDWGFPVAPRDFTSGPLKVGDAPEDLYKTFITGLNGTPMPSFSDSITPEESWALVAYVRSLRVE